MNNFRAYQIISVHEGVKSWLYKDNKGFVTGGIGNYFPTVESCLALDWVRKDGSAAPSTEVIAAYQTVSKCGVGFRASYYAQFTNVRLTIQAIENLFFSRVAEFGKQIQHYFPDFDTWPEGPQLGTLDWVFQCGIGNLIKTQHLAPALKSHQWNVASSACHRADASDERNDTTAKLFLEQPVT